MFKRSIVLGLILILSVVVLKWLVYAISGIQMSEFKPVSAIFLLDVSASNRDLMAKQEKTILKISKRLDSEDHAMIYLVTEDAYNVYNGNPHKLVDMRKAIEKRGEFNSKAYGTAYGTALLKAVGDALHYKANGYTPIIIVLGDLENEGNVTRQINWNVLPKNIKNTLKFIPDLRLAFLYAHPQKNDEVRGLLLPVFDKNAGNLFFASEENVEQETKKILESIGR